MPAVLVFIQEASRRCCAAEHPISNEKGNDGRTIGQRLEGLDPDPIRGGERGGNISSGQARSDRQDRRAGAIHGCAV